jgi:hypothetical protein
MVRGWVSYGLRWLSSNLRVAQESFEGFFSLLIKERKKKKVSQRRRKGERQKQNRLVRHCNLSTRILH